MFGMIGIVVTFAMVFGGYIMAGGKLEVILHSLPFEMMMIGGAAIGSFLLSNETAVIKQSLAGLGRSLKGPRWHESDLQDVLCLLFQLLRIARASPVELEEHIENPENSPVFQTYPRILADHNAVTLITDTLRSASLNYDDPYQVEEMLSQRIGLMNEEAMHAPCAAEHGRRAAGAGHRRRRAGRDQDHERHRPAPEVLGKMIGGALVGTFLGVFLAYALVAPFAQRLSAVMKQDQAFYDVIKSVLVAGLHQRATNLCVEVGRQAAPEHVRPSFGELETALRELKRAS